jgi:hypothetical protein
MRWIATNRKSETLKSLEDIYSQFAGVIFTFLSSALRNNAYLPKASPPASSTFTLPHSPLTRAFSSEVKCTMMSGLGACW